MPIPAGIPSWDDMDAGTRSYWASLAAGQDPSFQAVQRSIDAQKQAEMIAVGRQMDLIKGQGERQLAEIPIKGERSRTQISGGFEARGLYRSGAHEKKLGEQRSDEARQTANTQAAIQDRLAGLSIDMSLKMADLDRQRAESNLTYSSRYL